MLLSDFVINSAGGQVVVNTTVGLGTEAGKQGAKNFVGKGTTTFSPTPKV